MKPKYLWRSVAIGGACVAAVGLTGLPFADASTSARMAEAGSGETQILHCLKFDVGDPGVCAIYVKGAPGPKGLRGKTGAVGPQGPQGGQGTQGPQGPQGSVGPDGAVGPTGQIGSTGPTGQTGATGQTGPIGVTGATGPQGIQGAPGPTIVLTGTPVVESANGSAVPEGTELPPAVARCQGGADPEAYGGGEEIVKSGQHSGGDVVSIQSHYLGTYSSGTVTPPSSGSTGAADAFEAQAVVIELASGDQVTETPYVVCGP